MFTSIFLGDYNYKEFIEVDNEFYALLDSVLNKSTIHILLNYKIEIDYRSINRVILIN